MHSPLIPGIFDKKMNVGIHYCHIVAGLITLLLILIVTTVTVATVTRVHETVANTNELIRDMNELLPDARFGLQMLDLLCHNKNFTSHYQNVGEVCAKQP